MLLIVTATTVTGTLMAENNESLIKEENPKMIPTGRDIWLHYDDGTNENAIGLIDGGTFYFAIRLTPYELNLYSGYELIRVRWHHGMEEGTPEPSHSGDIIIYDEGTNESPGDVITTEPYTSPAENVWFNTNLSNPVPINVSKDMWVCVEVTHGAGEFPAGVGPGPVVSGKGGWISLDGTTWEQLGIDYPELDYNWNLWAGLEFASEPPEAPRIPDGPDDGVTDVEYTFSTNTTDPEGDQIYYKFDWGNGEKSEWIGPYNSGDIGSASYIWQEGGDYEVRAKAKDIHNKESNWSEPHTIHITQGARVDIGVIKGGLFKVSTPIKNTGELPANGVQWKITLEGGAFIGKETTGTDDIPGGGEITATSGFILGLGNTEVTVTADIPDGDSDSRTQKGVILIFFINIKPGG